ncbi:hypothetical protein H5410_043263 [Solanum commersonii]|uniref:Uncharacterized protein n=1 Tax=Solanum commersonii TaxID=4109 RepID=A0A9J5XXY7_SOLCO|nr:hypothetical protein H5410_043263 [Solanum commersonii]
MALIPFQHRIAQLRQLGTFNYIVQAWQQCMKVPTIRVRPGPPSTWIIQRVIQRITSATFHKPAWLDYPDDEEEDLKTILKRYQQQLEESSSASTAGKGKEKI